MSEDAVLDEIKEDLAVYGRATEILIDALCEVRRFGPPEVAERASQALLDAMALFRERTTA